MKTLIMKETLADKEIHLYWRNQVRTLEYRLYRERRQTMSDVDARMLADEDAHEAGQRWREAMQEAAREILAERGMT